MDGEVFYLGEGLRHAHLGEVRDGHIRLEELRPRERWELELGTILGAMLRQSRNPLQHVIGVVLDVVTFRPVAVVEVDLVAELVRHDERLDRKSVV